MNPVSASSSGGSSNSGSDGSNISSNSGSSSDRDVDGGSGGNNESRKAQIDVTMTPAKHWTARGFFDKNRCLVGSFCIRSARKNGSSFFFGGDSAYDSSLFKHIGDLFGPFDLAMLPIGAYKPRWFLKGVHCSPYEAVQMHQDLKAQQTLGVHWGTFQLADEDDIEPVLALAHARSTAGLNSSEVCTIKHGETLPFGATPAIGSDLALARPDLLEHYTRWVQSSSNWEAAGGHGDPPIP
jgi:hypothetical protein